MSSALDPDSMAQVAAAAKVEAENNLFVLPAPPVLPVAGQTNSVRASDQSEGMRLINRAQGRDDERRLGGSIRSGAESGAAFLGEEQKSVWDVLIYPEDPPKALEPLIQLIDPAWNMSPPGKSSEIVTPNDIPGQVNDGPRRGLTTASPMIEQAEPILIYHGRDDDRPTEGVLQRGVKATGAAVDLTFEPSPWTWTTPAGLDYGQGSVQGNRVLHFLEHAKPNSAKTTHSVFNMDRKEILGVVDEAWLKRGASVVGDPGAYIVPMGRPVGTLGEANIKIIVRPGTNKVITAYPVK